MGNTMPKLIRLIAVLAVGGLIGACADISQVAKMKVKGGAYEKTLHKEYVKLAKAEAKATDWAVAEEFASRAAMAASGKPSWPASLSKRSLHKKHAKSLANGRKRLTNALSKGGTKKSPKQAAIAQAKFECWLQEAEENIAKKKIQKCRSAFYGAITLLEAAVWAAPK